MVRERERGCSYYSFRQRVNFVHARILTNEISADGELTGGERESKTIVVAACM